MLHRHTHRLSLTQHHLLLRRRHRSTRLFPMHPRSSLMLLHRLPISLRESLLNCQPVVLQHNSSFSTKPLTLSSGDIVSTPLPSNPKLCAECCITVGLTGPNPKLAYI